MGMSTLAVKPRGRVWRRANAHAGGCAERKAPAPHRSFLEQNKCFARRRRDYGSGEGRRCSVTRLTISDTRPSRARMNRRVAGGCRKATLQGFPSGPMAQVPISPPLAPTVSGVGPAAAGSWGDWAMWIIWYVAMGASLRAMGLAPRPVAVGAGGDGTPLTRLRVLRGYPPALL